MIYFLWLFLQISKYVERSDAVLLVIIPATQTPDVSSYRALRIAKEHDADSGSLLTRSAFCRFKEL